MKTLILSDCTSKNITESLLKNKKDILNSDQIFHLYLKNEINFNI